MTKAEFIEWVHDLEATLPVDEWKASGVPVWPFIRFELYASAFYPMFAEIGLGGGWRTQIATLARGFVAWARASVRDRRSNVPVDQPAEAVFLAYSIGVQPLVAGKRFNPLLAPYVALLHREGHRALVWEMAPYGEYNVPRYTPSHYIQPWLVFLRIVCRLTKPGDQGLSLKGWDQFVKQVAAARLTSRYLAPGAIARDAYFVRRLANGFKRRLRRAAPVLGFTADYGLREQAFCLACRELGILSVDIQHGIQGDLHPAYGSWGRVPDEGYAVKPDVHWCWDEASAAAINRWAGRGARHRAIVGGDAWRETWLNGADELVRRFDEEIVRRKQASAADVHVLVTLDSTGEVVPRFVLEAFRRSPPTWCYWVRLHPVNQRARRPLAADLLRSGEFRAMDLDEVAQLPLHGLLRHVDVHLTISLSSVILEAEAFGVPSIACDLEAAELYSPQLATGVLRVARSTSEVTEAIGELAGLHPARQGPRGPAPAQALRSLLETRLPRP